LALKAIVLTQLGRPIQWLKEMSEGKEVTMLHREEHEKIILTDMMKLARLKYELKKNEMK